MASIVALKRRIGSIKNTRQITKAMQLVSASKMRRAQEYALKSRDYRDLANDILSRLGDVRDVAQQPLFKKRTIKQKLYVVITSNSGLAGAYNSNVLRLLTRNVIKDREAKIQSKVIAIGNRGAQLVRRFEGVELLAVYNAFGDQPTANDIRPVLSSVMEQFETEAVDEVDVLYTLFKSNIVQEATISTLLPASTENIPEKAANTPAITNFEPSVETVIANITERLVEAQLFQALLESLASEHSMRMLAMKNATDNANDLIDDYTLEYNTARQAGITQELAEITGGAEALND